MSSANANLKPLLLHAHATGPNPYKIASALEILSLPWEIRMWDFSDDADKGVKGSKFLAVNPNGRVPAVEDPNTGVTSWESGACMNYLRRVYDKSNILGPKGANGAEANEQDIVDFEKWEYFLLSTLGPMQGQVNWFKHYNPTKNEDALNRYRAQTYRCYGVLEGQLAKSGGKTILPGGLSAVDLHFQGWIHGYGFAGLSLDEYPNIKKWLEGIEEREHIKKAYKKLGEAGGH